MAKIMETEIRNITSFQTIFPCTTYRHSLTSCHTRKYISSINTTYFCMILQNVESMPCQWY